ncbi:MAG: IS6 family transposase [Candidatus Aldehydirespiratoraceae bacterium]
MHATADTRSANVTVPRTASVVIRWHAFIQNLRRDHYELGVESRHEHLRVTAAFDELNASI